MITITINTVELDMDSKRGLIKTLRGVIEEYKAGYTLVSQDDNKDIQLPIDPIGEEYDDRTANDSLIDKIVDEHLAEWNDLSQEEKNKNKREAEYERTGFDDITEEEYNDLFQQDHKDQNDEVEKDIADRSKAYDSDRPIDP